MTRNHASCYHTRYVLTCTEYEDLLRYADDHCMLCQAKRPAGRSLNIDHDHALGPWAVRGLVCDRCNQALRYVDAGEKPDWLRIRHYLDNAWHLSQPGSAEKAAREKPRTTCPTCGQEGVAVNKNGSLRQHKRILRVDGRPVPGGGVCPGTNGALATGQMRRAVGSNVIPFKAAQRRRPKR
ncbi:endonuclease domain-containing protein [Streptomyces sp. MB22_4]|uniref:endonuclease domain-containing protein n=1 Tax=Streptomyces sp. MB22_4 TaxID=3383120 RepID=UPI00399FE6DF